MEGAVILGKYKVLKDLDPVGGYFNVEMIQDTETNEFLIKKTLREGVQPNVLTSYFRVWERLNSFGFPVQNRMELVETESPAVLESNVIPHQGQVYIPRKPKFTPDGRVEQNTMQPLQLVNQREIEAEIEEISYMASSRNIEIKSRAFVIVASPIPDSNKYIGKVMVANLKALNVDIDRDRFPTSQNMVRGMEFLQNMLQMTELGQQIEFTESDALTDTKKAEFARNARERLFSLFMILVSSNSNSADKAVASFKTIIEDSHAKDYPTLVSNAFAHTKLDPSGKLSGIVAHILEEIERLSTLLGSNLPKLEKKLLGGNKKTYAEELIVHMYNVHRKAIELENQYLPEKYKFLKDQLNAPFYDFVGYLFGQYGKSSLKDKVNLVFPESAFGMAAAAAAETKEN